MMKVTFHASCLTLLGPIHHWANTLSDKALQAWASRPQGESVARVLVQVPSEAGKRYHFFKVEPHHRHAGLLNVRA